MTTHLLLLLSAWVTYFSCVVGSSEFKNNNILCVDSERDALVHFKHGIRVDNCGILDDWGHSHDCCQWYGIRCNNQSGHVIGINLPGIETDYFAGCLRSRSREIVSGGGLVLVLQGCFDSKDPDSIWELFGSTLQDMVIEGMIEQEKLDKFDMPFYSPAVDEVRKLVEAEGSFVLNKLETFIVDWSIDTSQSLETRAKLVTKTIRAVTESLLANAFSHAVMDDLFQLFETRVMKRLAGKRSEYLNIVLSVTNKE